MPVKKEDELKIQLEDLKKKYNSSRNENSTLRAKLAETTDRNCEFWSQDRRNKVSGMILQDYQKLIFG